MNYSSGLAFLGAVCLTICCSGNANSVAAFQDDAPAEFAEVEIVKEQDAISTWVLDNDHTSMIFAVSHSGLSYVYGRFNEVSGTVIIDAERPESSKFSFTVVPASVDTNNKDRDQRLISKEFLDTSQFDSISFTSTDVKLKVEPKPSGEAKRTFIVGGNLTLHGETRRIVVPIELLAAGKGKDGQYRCGFMSKFVVKRSSHGIEAMQEEVGDSVAVTFSFQAIQKTEEPAESDDGENASNTVEAEEPTEERDDPESQLSRIELLCR